MSLFSPAPLQAAALPPCPGCSAQLLPIDHQGRAWWLCDVCGVVMPRT